MVLGPLSGKKRAQNHLSTQGGFIGYSLLYRIKPQPQGSGGDVMSEQSERTTRARIRDAAFIRFAEHGFARTHLKDIAADVGVTTPLITHHFGSKAGLLAACDEHVAKLIKDLKTRAMAEGMEGNVLHLIRETYAGLPIGAYLARTIADGSSDVDHIVDLMVEDAVNYTRDGIASGVIRPMDRLEEKVAVLTMWSLGTLVLHRHIERLLGVDIIGGDPDSLATWSALTTDLLTHRIINPDYTTKLQQSLHTLAADTSNAQASTAKTPRTTTDSTKESP